MVSCRFVVLLACTWVVCSCSADSSGPTSLLVDEDQVPGPTAGPDVGNPRSPDPGSPRSPMDQGPDAGSHPVPDGGAPRALNLAAAVAWPEADRLFHQDPRWLGGDGGSSLALAPGRILWLLDDSFIATSSKHVRTEAKMIRNCVAIQTGTDPSTATMRFFWKESGGKPASFFPPAGESIFWPTAATLVDGRLLIFLMKECRTGGEPPSAACGFDVLQVDNPSDDPSSWQMHSLRPTQNSFGVVVGSASVFSQDGFLYTYGSFEPSDHDIYLVRYALDRVRRGDLSGPQWWCGDPSRSMCGGPTGWIGQEQLARAPVPIFDNARTEFTVHFEPRAGRYLEIQSSPGTAGPLQARWADRMVGPFTPLKSFFRPSEADRSGSKIYQGKAHPELTGADLVVTYESNVKGAQLQDMSVYFPRFVKVRLEP